MGSIFKPALVLFTVCLVVTAALACTYAGTKDIIAERAEIDAVNSRKEVLADAQAFEEVDNINELVKENPELNLVKEVYKGIKDDSVIGYVFTVVTKGYGGDLKLMVGMDNQGEIVDVKICESNETPGLGSKASDEPFNSQLSGFIPQEPLKVVKNKAEKPEEIEAISGATITSRGVVNGIQAAVDAWKQMDKEEGMNN